MQPELFNVPGGEAQNVADALILADFGLASVAVFERVHRSEVLLAENEIFQVLPIDLSLGEESSGAMDALASELKKIARVGRRLFSEILEERLSEILALIKGRLQDRIEIKASHGTLWIQ